jgi:hypothetical protein
VHSLRLPGETDDEFRKRAEHSAHIVRALIAGCLQNRRIQELLAEGTLTEQDCQRNPTVRVEFEQAIAIGGIGETLRATKSKHWGDGPWILPLEQEDDFFTDRITYFFRDNSTYNRRFEQRKRLKELLGTRFRPLVGNAQSQYTTKRIFLRGLTEEQAKAIRDILGVEPGEFWRACKGKTFLDLPARLIQLELFER